MLLIQDGHSSHVSIELIECARANDIHLLCLPAHTTHILQPLDVGVFKSFKAAFSKACRNYMLKHPGRVITTDVIAALVEESDASGLYTTQYPEWLQKVWNTTLKSQGS